MQLLDTLGHAIAPSSKNSYRPYLLRKNALTFFLAVVLVAEGSFAASIFGVNLSQHMFATVAAAPAVSLAPAPAESFNQALKVSAGAASNTQTTVQWVLWAVVVLLGALLVVAVVRHVRVQPHDLILPGIAVLLLALFFLWCNAVFGPVAPGDNALAAPGPAQYHW